MADDHAITGFLQRRLTTLGLAEVPAVEAARWLDDAGILADSSDRPGLPLRNLLRAGRIDGARQLPNRRWFIVRLTNPNSDGAAPTPAPAAATPPGAARSVRAGGSSGSSSPRAGDLKRPSSRPLALAASSDSSGSTSAASRHDPGSMSCCASPM